MQVVLAKEKIGRNDACPCGSGKKYKQCCLRNNPATSSTTSATISTPLPIDQLALEPNLIAGIRKLEKIIENNPNDQATLTALADIMMVMQHYPTAKNLYERIIAILSAQKHTAELSLAAPELIDKAKESLLKAYLNYVIVLDILEEYETITTIHPEILQLTPNKAIVYLCLGSKNLGLGQDTKALSYFLKALELGEKSAEVYYSVGFLYQKMHLFQQAIAYYDAALALDPSHVKSKFNKFSALDDMGSFQEAQHYAQTIMAEHANDPAVIADIQIRLLFLIPVFMESQTQIDAFRADFLRRIQTLIEKKTPLNYQNVFTHNTFLLAFQNRNNKEIMQSIAKLLRQSCPILTYTAPHCLIPSTRDAASTIKIGVFSNNLMNHSVSTCFIGLIETLNTNPDVELYFFSNRNKKEYGASQFIESVRYVQLSSRLESARETIASYALDTLIYLDIGLQKFNYHLSFARLAPIQCVFPGHPDTTGVDTIDYHLSTKQQEGPTAQEYYSERLVTLENFPVCYSKPQMPERLLSRKELGLQDDVHYYACPMMLQKIHPDFDEAILKILQKDSNARVILLFKTNSTAYQQLRNRLHKHLSSWFERVELREALPRDEFFSLLYRVDVALDSFHFGGGNTSYIANTLGVPMVTLPGRFNRARATEALYKQMGILDLIANDVEHYVDIAVRLGTDPNYNKHMRDTILARNECIFNDTRYADELLEFLRAAVNGRDTSAWLAAPVI